MCLTENKLTLTAIIRPSTICQILREALFYILVTFDVEVFLKKDKMPITHDHPIYKFVNGVSIILPNYSLIVIVSPMIDTLQISFAKLSNFPFFDVPTAKGFLYSSDFVVFQVK